MVSLAHVHLCTLSTGTYPPALDDPGPDDAVPPFGGIRALEAGGIALLLLATELLLALLRHAVAAAVRRCAQLQHGAPLTSK